MRKIAAFAFLLLFLPVWVVAQIPPVGSLTVGTTSVTNGTNGDCLTISGGKLGQTASCGAAAGLTVGTSTITGGSTGRIVYDNAGVVGETANWTTNGTAITGAASTTLAVGGAAIGSYSLATTGSLASIPTGSAGTSFNDKVVDITAMDSNATLWNGGAGVFANACGSPVANDVYAWGWNMAPGNGVLSAGKPVIGISIERCYSAAGDGSDRASELHLTSWTSAGVERRLFTSNVRHDGSAITTAMTADSVALNDRTSTTQFQFNVASKNLSVNNSGTISFGINNVATIQQENASGSGLTNLPYIGSDDMLIMPGALRAIGNVPTTGSFIGSMFRLQATSMSANGRLIDGVVAATSGIDVQAFNITGPVAAGRFTGLIANTASSSSSAHAQLELSTTSSGGTPMVFWSNGSQNWYAGPDRNASNSWKVGTDQIGSADKLILSTSGNLTVTGSVSATLTNTATTSAVCYNTSTGLFTYDGTIGTCNTSAKRFKTVLDEVKLPLAAIDVLHAGVWKYDQTKGEPGQFDTRIHVGLYADDVEKMDKRCVGYKDGKLQDYDERCVIAYLAGAVKELKSEMNSLKASK